MFFCHIQSTHSQIKIFVSPCLAWFLLDEKTSWFPSGLNTGNPSNPEKVVICSKLFPSIPTAHKSKFLPFGSFIFEEKITLLSSVKKYGAKLAPSLFVIFILFYEKYFLERRFRSQVFCRSLAELELLSIERIS